LTCFILADVVPHLVQLDDNELKMLLAAIRQVQHTFTIAEAQSVAAGEPLAADYENLREAYAQLHRKLLALSGATGAGQPRIVK
jgi:hypothetical protein